MTRKPRLSCASWQTILKRARWSYTVLQPLHMLRIKSSRFVKSLSRYWRNIQSRGRKSSKNNSEQEGRISSAFIAQCSHSKQAKEAWNEVDRKSTRLNSS